MGDPTYSSQSQHSSGIPPQSPYGSGVPVMAAYPSAVPQNAQNPPSDAQHVGYVEMGGLSSTLMPANAPDAPTEASTAPLSAQHSPPTT
jgi:hypothetical protein